MIIKNTLVSALLFGTSVDLRLVRQASAAAHVLTQWPFEDVGVLMTLELQNPLNHEVVKGILLRHFVGEVYLIAFGVHETRIPRFGVTNQTRIKRCPRAFLESCFIRGNGYQSISKSMEF